MPTIPPLADRTYKSFLSYIELRDDRLNSVCFDRTGLEPVSTPKKRNKCLIRAYVDICETLLSIKAFCEEGVFRKPGMKAQVTNYATRVKNVGLQVIC